MQNILLLSLSTQELSVNPQLIGWKDFYLNFIVCNLNNEQIYAEYLRAKTLNTVLLRDRNCYEFIHNLILNIVLTDFSYLPMIKQGDSVKVIETKSFVEFDCLANLVFETLDIIARYSKSIQNLDDVYSALASLIEPKKFKNIYPPSKFNKTCFYNLINVNMRTAQYRNKQLENKNDQKY